MKEVSCRFFETLLRDLRERAIDPRRLVEGTPYTVAHIADKDERIDWPAFLRMMENGRALWTRDELLKIGERSTESPLVQFIGVIARMRFSVKGFYHWVADPKGVASQMFTCLETSCRSEGAGRVVIELRMRPGYIASEELFLVSQGTYTAMPRMLGAAKARTTAQLFEGGVHVHVEYVEPRGVSTWIRRAVTWPFNLRQAADELADAHDSLQARYEELESARHAVERQRATLQTAHQLGQRIWGERDPDATATAILDSLVSEGGSAGAALELSLRDGSVVPTRMTAGRPGPAGAGLRIDLTGSGRVAGSVEVWPAPAADLGEARMLLDLIAPTMALALENAVAYRELAAYQLGLERRVEARTRDLSTARDQLAATVGRLEEAQQSRERLFQNISHEIRTPLSLILLSVDSVMTAQRARLEDGAVEHLTTVTTSARKLVRLVDELLLLAAGQDRELRVTPVPTDLHQALGEIVAGWRLAAEVAGLTIVLAAPPDVAARVDPVALERVVSNLLSNALKFTPTGGTITVQVTPGDPIGLSVFDTGFGIDDDLASRLFGRFEQGTTGRATRGGSGIGLSIVRELVGAHGGEVGCRPNPGGGTEFWLTLPPSKDEAVRPAPPPRLMPSDFGIATSREVPAPYRAPAGNAQAVIVVAEDDLALAEAIARLLALEHVVHLAHDGISALALVQQHRPDLVVTDVQMPGLDGVELTERIQEIPGGHAPPVLVLSARADLDNRLAGLAAGAVDYLVKPFDPAELRARVRTQLAHRALAQRLFRVEKLASLGSMSAGLAHELRNPANGIVNAIGPLKELLPPELLNPDEPVGQLIDVMAECAAQVAFLSRQLLGVRRSGDLEFKRIPVADAVTRALSNASAALAGVELRTRYDYTGIVRCSPPIITQVLVNLLENGAQAAGKGGWVELAVNRAEGHIIFDVSDSGPGVQADLRERIFEPFFTTKPPGQGTGLGLSTSRELIHRHGGTLEVRVRGERTVFSVEIPEPREVS